MVLLGENGKPGDVIGHVLNFGPDNLNVVQVGRPSWRNGGRRQGALFHVGNRR